MAHNIRVADQLTARSSDAPRLGDGIPFDRAMTLLSGWFILGIFLDAWAHSHGRTDETFFTPWHAVLYSGFLALAAFFGLTIYRNHAAGQRWRAAVPAGYELSLLGIGIFAMGGMGDMIWHELLGVEANLEALMSPPHLLLGSGATLFLTGPLRAAWQRPQRSGAWATLLPVIGSLAFVLALWSFFTSYAHPFVYPWAAQSYHLSRSGFGQALGIAGIVLQTALLMGLTLFAIRRWTLPVGSLALVFTFSATLISSLEDNYVFILVALLAGLVADGLVWWLKPSAARPHMFRAFAFVVPVLLWLCYFTALMLTGGIWWTTHLWLGSVFLAGIVGLLLSYLLVPPVMPDASV